MQRSSSIKRRAFTLVELMVVMLIIGMLASVAIPMMDKYMRKTKASEAFIGISNVYKAVIAYHPVMTSMLNSDGEPAFEWETNYAFPHLYSRAADSSPMYPQGREEIFFLNPSGCNNDPTCSYQSWEEVGANFDSAYLNYRYRVEVDPNVASKAKAGNENNTFRVIAEGDLDSDNVTALYSRSGWVTADSSVVSGQVVYSNPLE